MLLAVFPLTQALSARQHKARITGTGERPLSVDTQLLTATIGVEALINVFTQTAVQVQQEAGLAATCVPSRVVVADLSATAVKAFTLVYICACFAISLQLIAFATGALWPISRVFTLVCTASIANVAVVHYFHLNPFYVDRDVRLWVARLSVHTQLVARSAGAPKGAGSVDT